jgi:hypothetical protein
VLCHTWDVPTTPPLTLFSGCLKTALRQTLEGESDAFTTKLIQHIKDVAVSSTSPSSRSSLFSTEVTHRRNGSWCLLEGLASCSAKVSAGAHAQTQAKMEVVEAIR